MKLNIFTKLFLAVLTATLVVILFMVIFMNWSFQQGFTNYQHETELKRMQAFALSLANEFEQEGNWNFLRNNPRGWQSRLIKLGDKDAMRAQSKRMRLRDITGSLIAGQPPATEAPPTQVDILVKLEPVGWLELDKQQIISDALGNSFMQQQAKSIYLSALFAALLSLLITLIVVRQFLIPVKHLIAGANSLSGGDFSTQISVNSNDELGELAERFNQLADFLQRNEELRGQWIADISHELRTPIAILRSEIEAMLDGIRKPDLERIRSLHADVLSLGQLVDDLYQLSLSDAGDLELANETVDLSLLLSDLLSVFTSRLQEKAIQLTHNINPDKAIYIQGDDKRLHQLFSNLMENSYRYTDKGGKVEVRVYVQVANKQCVVTVTDSSPGVPDEALPRLFDRLYRVDKSRSRVLGGSGLGLSICKNIVKIHQGKISAGHAALGGLVITLIFPLKKQVGATALASAEYQHLATKDLLNG